MDINTFEHTLNTWGQQRVPFLFMVDFEMQKAQAFQLTRIDATKILFDINGRTNASLPGIAVKPYTLSKFPGSLERYKKKFDSVYQHLNHGNSYLTNLTVKTEIKITVPLRDLFYLSRAKYKLLYNDEFLVFSPETFIRIENGSIYAYPMKGTMDATVPDARNIILNDRKELAEHVTIVDLIRNDLSQIADHVTVSRFRFVDQIRTDHKDLLQVSSEIVGKLPNDYHSKLGTLLLALLPAGSVSGAPKPKTVDIIREAEAEPRGYYTGVAGIFDGQNLDSGVMIRFIEHIDGKYYYRSGGGITTQSVCELEYQEAIDKIYVPLN